MRRSILLTALALGAQAAWAQDVTDPAPPDDGVIVEETMETGDPGTDVVEEEPGDPETDVVEEETGDPETDVVEEEPVDPETDVVEDDTDGEVVVEESDNRSPRGAFRGGHHGSVSTLARAGLGPVFGKLRSQGYGGIEIEQVGGQIFVSAEREGEVRNLVYDAATGALLSDVSAPASAGIVQAVSSKLKDARGKRARDAMSADVRGGKGSGGKGGGNGNGKGGGNGNGRGGNGNGHGGGNGNGKNR